MAIECLTSAARFSILLLNELKYYLVSLICQLFKCINTLNPLSLLVYTVETSSAAGLSVPAKGIPLRELQIETEILML